MRSNRKYEELSNLGIVPTTSLKETLMRTSMVSSILSREVFFIKSITVGTYLGDVKYVYVYTYIPNWASLLNSCIGTDMVKRARSI